MIKNILLFIIISVLIGNFVVKPLIDKAAINYANDRIEFEEKLPELLEWYDNHRLGLTFSNTIKVISETYGRRWGKWFQQEIMNDLNKSIENKVEQARSALPVRRTNEN